MKKIFVLLFVSLFLFSCAPPAKIYDKIKGKYPNCQIIKLEGSSDQYIIYTKNKEIRFIDVDRFEKTIEVNQEINLIGG